MFGGVLFESFKFAAWILRVNSEDFLELLQGFPGRLAVEPLYCRYRKSALRKFQREFEAEIFWDSSVAYLFQDVNDALQRKLGSARVIKERIGQLGKRNFDQGGEEQSIECS